MAKMEDRWLSVSEIDKHLGVRNDAMFKWIDKHFISADRMGLLWKFKKDQVDTWVEAGCVADRNKKGSDE
jgi:excisionase family DNA binding protein